MFEPTKLILTTGSSRSVRSRRPLTLSLATPSRRRGRLGRPGASDSPPCTGQAASQAPARSGRRRGRHARPALGGPDPAAAADRCSARGHPRRHVAVLVLGDLEELGKDTSRHRSGGGAMEFSHTISLATILAVWASTWEFAMVLPARTAGQCRTVRELGIDDGALIAAPPTLLDTLARCDHRDPRGGHQRPTEGRSRVRSHSPARPIRLRAQTRSRAARREASTNFGLCAPVARQS